MKKIKLLSALFMLFGAISLTSCNSDDSEPVNNVPTGNSITLNLNGDPIAFSGAGIQNSGTLALNGLNQATMMGVFMELPADITVGTHPVGSSPFTGVFISISNVNEGAVESVSGTLTVTSKTSNNITGTFSFEGEDWDGNAHQVTNGQFNVHYQ